MSKIHSWWKEDPSEIFWLELTHRKDIGTNLKTPQENEKGKDFWGYSLIHEVRENDRIYHYDGNKKAIIASSLAVGRVWADNLVWAARGPSARTARIEPHIRPGWYLGLEQFHRLEQPISLSEIRNKAAEVKALVGSLVRKFGNPLYFPFETGERLMRPTQGYLFKLPSAFLHLFGYPSTHSNSLAIETHRTPELGDDYREADELTTIQEIDPFSVDPTLVERGVRGHAVTQNRLAEYLTGLGVQPRSSKDGEPNFDIAWWANERIFVGEVKSLTAQNEEKQLRLGLGQVLRYAHEFRERGRAIPVLAVERRPTDPSWEHLCHELNVILTWPEKFASSKLH